MVSFRCYDNSDVIDCIPDHDKFSSLSNKTVVAIFPNVCLWRRSCAQNWVVLTLKNCCSIEPPSYASAAYVVASYGTHFFSTVRFVKKRTTCENFLGKWFTAPPPPTLAKNFPYACVDKIPPWFKIANITHALPVPVYPQIDFTPKLQSRPKPVSTGVENKSLTEIACSRLRDSGESEKSFKDKKTRGGWGERGSGAFLSHFSRRHRPLCQVARVLF